MIWTLIFSVGGLTGAALQYFAINKFGRGNIKYIENKKRKFGAEPFYYFIKAKDKSYGNVDLMFTNAEMRDMMQRADANKEDI